MASAMILLELARAGNGRKRSMASTLMRNAMRSRCHIPASVLTFTSTDCKFVGTREKRCWTSVRRATGGTMKRHGRRGLVAAILGIVVLSVGGCVDERIVHRDGAVVGELPANHTNLLRLTRHA